MSTDPEVGGGPRPRPRAFRPAGTALGVITEITVALQPAPEAPLTAVAFFDDLAGACATVTEVMAEGGPRPSRLELMEPTSMEVVRDPPPDRCRDPRGRRPRWRTGRAWS